MNIFKHEFKSYLKSVGIWSVAIFLVILVYFSAFSSIAVETEDLANLMSSFPDELLIAFGMDSMNFTTLLGFYVVVFLFCQVCLSIRLQLWIFPGIY